MFHKHGNRKRILTLGILLLLSPVIILMVEFVLYQRFVTKLQNAQNLLANGMNKEQVINVIDSPEFIKKDDSGEIYYWLASKHQGRLTKIFGFNTIKGHYELIIMFDKTGKVVRILSGIN